MNTTSIARYRPQQKEFFWLQCLRLLLAFGATLFITEVVDLGTNSWSPLSAALLGTLLAGILLSRLWGTPKAFILHLFLFGLGSVIFSFLHFFLTSQPGSPAHHDFLSYRLQDHAFVWSLFYLLSFFSTWIFWKSRITVSLEAFAFAGGLIWVLRGHRNYQLDAPKQTSAIAWALGVEHQHLLLALGVAFSVLLGFYLLAASRRSLFGAPSPIPHRGRAQRGALFFTPIICFLALVLYARIINERYSADLSRASSGVGQVGEEGTSPLGFHDAVGKTKQPSALVRLESDYTANPWTPMLYMREGALSEFNGRELVLASREFDSDVPRIVPGQPYVSFTNQEDPNRTKFSHSVYLLTDHTSIFAIDFPTSIRLIKNPDPERFKVTYQAHSLAPIFPLKSLSGETVGDPNWHDQFRAHYLQAPGSRTKALPFLVDFNSKEPVLDEFGEDLRYRAFAEHLTAGIAEPVLRAARISEFLSQESIYTRNPGHTLTERGDPVAPYLFSDSKRGYCVHFAHAAVYMMRLAGVPARIATGYLTDLTYAKDGHILLHLGDRHAWPEIYVDGHGWVVVDVTPAQAENEEPIIPDNNLLEELMSKIDPAEELLTPPEVATDPLLKDQDLLSNLFRIKAITPVLLSAVIFWILFKFYLRFGYLLTGNEKKRALLAHSALASSLADMGIFREIGETRHEFALRVKETHRLDLSNMTQLYLNAAYKPIAAGSGKETTSQIRTAFEKFSASLSSTKRRIFYALSFFSPLSLIRFRKW